MGIVLLLTPACTAVPAWGSKATLFPSWERVRSAAHAAVTDPQTWAPLAGAALVQIGDADHAISSWAKNETPLFGSNRTAEDVSDVLLDTARLGWGASVLLTPSGPDPGGGVLNKVKGAGVELAAFLAQETAVDLLKDATRRMRPDGTRRRSFPSAHTASVASFGALTRRNADAMPLTRTQKEALNAASTALTAVTGWARIEAGRHYPTDVLAGWGLSNAISVFVHDAFLGRETRGPRIRVRVQPRSIGVGLSLDL